MTYFLEVGPDRNVIEWQTHLLSDVMEMCAPALTLELMNHAEADSPARLLDCSSDHKGVSWMWGTDRGIWQQVKAQSFDPPGDRTEVLRRYPQPNSISWEELSLCDSVELTPFDAQGKAGATIRIERPLRLTPQDVVCEDLTRGLVRVLLPRYGRPQDLRVRLLDLSGSKHYPRVRLDAFNVRRFAQIQLGDGFRGTIAIVHYRGEKQRLMYYLGWPGKGRINPQIRFRENGEPLDQKEYEDMRRCVEGDGPADSTATAQINGWMDAWPSRSRQRLRGIYTEAVNSIAYNVDAARALRETPRGFFRALVLYRCDYPFSLSLSEIIRRLDAGPMRDALEGLSPGLPSLLEGVSSAEEKKWVVANASHPKLAEAVDWAGGSGVKPLKQALDLINVRDGIKERQEKLRHGTPERQEAEEILDKIEQAPFDDSSVEELKHRVEEIARVVEDEECRAVNPEGEPPRTVHEYHEWVERRRRMKQWRNRLAAILTYCSSGEWQASPESVVGLPSAEELVERVGRVKAPLRVTLRQPLRMVKDHAQELSERAQALIEQQSDEPSEKLKARACACLQTVIIQHAAGWAPMFEQIALAETKSVSYPWLAAGVGLTVASDDHSRADAAGRLLSLVEAVEAHAARSPFERLAKDTAELRAILADPRHPAIEREFKRACELRNFLSPTEYVRQLPIPQRLSPPEYPSQDALQRWWRTLDELEAALGRLEAGRDRFRVDVNNFQKNLLPRVNVRLRYWKTRPSTERPDHYAEFLALSERCAGPVDSVKPEDLLQLIEILEKENRLRGQDNGN